MEAGIYKNLSLSKGHCVYYGRAEVSSKLRNIFILSDIVKVQWLGEPTVLHEWHLSIYLIDDKLNMQHNRTHTYIFLPIWNVYI